MAMRKKSRNIDIFSLSFLDVVSCGFGAIILLLVISHFSEPRVSREFTEDLRTTVRQLEQKKAVLAVKATEMDRALKLAEKEMKSREQRLAKLQKELDVARMRRQSAVTDQDVQKIIVRQLEAARQELTEETEALQARQPHVSAHSQAIAGIPVDSRYIIFVIDTSGSMQRFAWPLVRKKMREILKIYPRIKGIQVMNDMGDYMFSQYAGRWIPDSPARRRAILSMLATWAPFSNSSPVEGITAAIRRFYSADKRISIYVLGDDFSKGSIQDVVDTVNRLNRAGRDGKRRVRIHAIGFPVLILESPDSPNISRFAALMRRLAEDNDGSFVGLSSLR